MRLDYRIQINDDGRRAGKLAASVFKLSNRDIEYLKASSSLLIDQKPYRMIDRVQYGQLLTVILPEPKKAEKAVSSISILYEDDALMVIDKPSGLATMSSHAVSGDSVEKCMQESFGDFRPVNRLDKGTGGLMVCAKSAYMQHRLSDQLHTDRFIREYIAVVEGRCNSPFGKIELPIGHMNGQTNLRCIRPDGKPCITYFRTLKTTENRSMLRLRLITGRTHQIRVHLSACGLPICGDYLYGTALEEKPGFFALHSTYLFLQHPLTSERLFFVSDPEKSFMQLLEE